MSIPTPKLRAVRHIIAHDNCPDGVASAMILKQVLPDAKVSFVQYNTPEHESMAPEEHALFCDFSPATPEGWVEKGAIVLDHHKTAKTVVEAFGELGVYADEAAEPGVCGALLAYREVWLQLAKEQYEGEAEVVETFSTLAGIRDTWQKHDSRWR